MQRKNILITGASSGLGETMAKMYAAQGCNLALCARRVDRLQKLQQEITKTNPDVTVSIRSLDVNEHDQVFEVFKLFAQDLGHLDRVIVNAGMGKGASIGKGYFQANKQTAMTNFVSAIAQCEAALELFRAQDHGHLVTISSVSARSGFPGGMTVYAATKAGLSSFSEGMRIDLLDTPIKVTTIHPGFIRSEISEEISTAPFMVDTETGCRAILKAIEKEGANYYVPCWPWAIVARLLAIAPLRLLAKIN